MTCSFAWDDAGLPAWGTAPRASFWVAVEQNGPWGNKAFTQCRLAPALGAAIESAALAAGGRALLIRRPASHADHHDHERRRVYVAGGLDGTPWLLTGLVDEPHQVLDLPFAELAGASPGELAVRFSWLEQEAGGVLLVCANAKRDLCCALRGRPVALELERDHPGRVWECTHTGGHRFAPTGVVLPTGQSVARLTGKVAEAALRAADAGLLAAETLGPWHDRGCGHLSPAVAVAEARVRELTGETRPDALTAAPAVVTGPDPEAGEVIEVTHRDGRRWLARVASVEHPERLPESCAKAAVTARSWRVVVTGPDAGSGALVSGTGQ